MALRRTQGGEGAGFALGLDQRRDPAQALDERRHAHQWVVAGHDGRAGLTTPSPAAVPPGASGGGELLDDAYVNTARRAQSLYCAASRPIPNPPVCGKLPVRWRNALRLLRPTRPLTAQSPRSPRPRLSRSESHGNVPTPRIAAIAVAARTGAAILIQSPQPWTARNRATSVTGRVRCRSKSGRAATWSAVLLMTQAVRTQPGPETDFASASTAKCGASSKICLTRLSPKESERATTPKVLYP
jgi:hypothetical protein